MNQCAHCHAPLDVADRGLVIHWVVAADEIDMTEEFCGLLCAAAYCAQLSDHSLVCGIDLNDYLNARHHDGVNSEEECPPIPPYKADFSPKGKGVLFMSETKEFGG